MIFNYITFNKRKIVFFLALFLLVVPVLLITLDNTSADASSLMSKVKGSSGDEIVKKVDTSGFKIVNVFRSIAVVVAVIFITWAGVIFWGAGGNPAKLSEAKGKLIWFFVALIFIFMAENIVATIADFFGMNEYIK